MSYISVKTEIAEIKGVLMKVLVLGGAGYVGRHVVKALIQQRWQVTVGCRKAKSAQQKLARAGISAELSTASRVGAGTENKVDALTVMRFETMTNCQDWQKVVRQFDVIVNCVGILRERWGENYRDVYVNAPAALARACCELAKPPRFIHITALGLRPDALSRFNTMKLCS